VRSLSRDLLPALLPVCFVLIFMALAAWHDAPFWEEAFRSDDAPVSWLSSVLLMAGAVLSLRLCTEQALPLRLGLPLALALLGMALDEQFMFHEWFKHSYLPASLRRQPAAWLADLPILVIGLGGILLAWRVGRAGLQASVGWLLRAAIGVGLFAIWIDVGAARRSGSPFLKKVSKCWRKVCFSQHCWPCANLLI